MAKKSTKETLVLVLALAVIIGARFIPGIGGLSADAVAVLGVFFGSLAQHDYAAGVRIYPGIWVWRYFFRSLRQHDGGVFDFYICAGVSAG